MQTELLIQAITNKVVLSDEDIKLIESVCHHKKIRKKHFVFEEGEIMRDMIFVTDGCLRSYSVDKNGFEHVLQFAPPGWWIGDMYSALKQTPGILNIDAIYDSEILTIRLADMEELYKKIPALERFFRMLAEGALATSQRRLIDGLSLTAVERYNNFCSSYPMLITCLPQKQVASYIGVTPEFLSKMLNSPMPKK